MALSKYRLSWCGQIFVSFAHLVADIFLTMAAPKWLDSFVSQSQATRPEVSEAPGSPGNRPGP